MSDILSQTIHAIAKLGADASDIDNKTQLGTVQVIRNDGAVVDVPLIVTAGGSSVNTGALTAAEQLMPPRRVGEYDFDDLASLVAFTARFKTSETAAYFTAPDLDAENPDGDVTVVFDDLTQGGAFGARRAFMAKMPLALGPVMKRYLENADKWLSSETFLGFIDERIDDHVTADLASVAMNVGATTSTSWNRRVDPGTGRISIRVEDESGPSVAVPRRFKVRLPVFAFDRASDVIELECSLRTRVRQKQLEWCFAFVDLAERLAQAVAVTKDTFAAAVPDVPSFRGSGPL